MIVSSHLNVVCMNLWKRRHSDNIAVVWFFSLPARACEGFLDLMPVESRVKQAKGLIVFVWGLFDLNKKKRHVCTICRNGNNLCTTSRNGNDFFTISSNGKDSFTISRNGRWVFIPHLEMVKRTLKETHFSMVYIQGDHFTISRNGKDSGVR